MFERRSTVGHIGREPGKKKEIWMFERGITVAHSGREPGP